MIKNLYCSKCGKIYPVSEVQTFAMCCNKPLLASYDLSVPISKNDIDSEENSMWRYFKFLPLISRENIISLNEGMTPIVPLERLASQLKMSSLLLKDESYNPTGSFKARGISMAVSKAKELGIDSFIIPTAGNAGGALAAYCAKANMKCIIVMPEHTPSIFKKECKTYGAEVILVNGLINDCAKKVVEIKKDVEYFNISTLKEPYRLEGKKTMGFEIAEQLQWKLPGVIIYPAGGGTGLIGIWKAFNEMITLGWIKKPLPKMIAVQASNCAPLAAAYHSAEWKKNFKPKATLANGLAVPDPFGMDLMLDVIHQSNGTVVTVSEEEIISGIKEVATTEGILLSPEGSATWMALTSLLMKNVIQPNQSVLLLNTGSGYKYLESVF
ncbi:MAG: threonine synthase [Flavisolibacter sp.]